MEENINENNEFENDKEIENTEIESIDKIKENKRKFKSEIVFHLVAVICIALFCIAISPKSLQNDTFYTIAIGEHIYNNGISDLTKDIYSIHDIPYTYPHWLYDLCIFIIYNSFGHLGIYISTMVLAAILGASIYCLSYKKSKSKILSFVITIGAMYILKSFIAARAQLVTFILFVWTIFCIEKFLETRKKRYAFLLILIPLLIANLHCAVFPFYFVLFLPYFAEYAIVALEDSCFDLKILKIICYIIKKITRNKEKKERFGRIIEKIKEDEHDRKRKLKIIRRRPGKLIVEKNKAIWALLIIMLIAGCTGFINPAGTGAYTYLYKTLKGNSTQSINEHLPLTLVENKEFAISVVIFIIFLIIPYSKIKLSDAFFIAGLTFLAFKSRRQVSVFAIICAPILVKLIYETSKEYYGNVFEKIENFLSGWFGAIVCICLCIIWCTNIIKPTLSERYVNIDEYPVEAADWILENLDVNNIRLYNEYNYGSYLIYRGIPVFFDSRCDLYTPEFNGTYNKETKKYDGDDIFTIGLNISGANNNYEDRFDEYKITHIILYDDSMLNAFLFRNSDAYKKVYDGRKFVIYERLKETQKINN